jgi:hypothetical protein
MNETTITLNHGKYKVGASVESKADKQAVLSVFPVTGGAAINIEFENSAGMMTFVGQVGEAVMKALREAKPIGECGGDL